jgi:hypothetical protein
MGLHSYSVCTILEVRAGALPFGVGIHEKSPQAAPLETLRNGASLRTEKSANLISAAQPLNFDGSSESERFAEDSQIIQNAHFIDMVAGTKFG